MVRETKNIHVSKKTWQELIQIRIKKDFETIDDAVQFILSDYYNEERKRNKKSGKNNKRDE